MSIQNVKQLNTTLTNARKYKAKYRDLIQEALVYFVNNYNGALDKNSTPLKTIINICGKEASFLRVWLNKYTNMKSINNDCLHFTTADKETTENGKQYYILKFNSNFNNQKWYETEAENEGIKAFGDKQALSLIKSLIKKMTGDEKTVTVDCAGLVKTLNEYQTKFEVALGK